MKKSTAEVIAELTGDDRTVTEAADHYAIHLEPCDCGDREDHLTGQGGAR